jgi:hypothetical protein
MMPLQRPRMIMITIARHEVGTSVVSSALLMLVIALSSAAFSKTFLQTVDRRDVGQARAPRARSGRVGRYR